MWVLTVLRARRRGYLRSPRWTCRRRQAQAPPARARSEAPRAVRRHLARHFLAREWPTASRGSAPGSGLRRGGPSGELRGPPTRVRPSQLPRPRRCGRDPQVLLERGLALGRRRPALSCFSPTMSGLVVSGSLSACPFALPPQPIGATPPVAAGSPHVRLGPWSAASGRSVRSLAP